MTNPARPVMFRAGGGPGENPQALPMVPLAYQPSSSSPAVYMADISEFQPDIADAAYLRWSQAIIIRAMYGDQHDDSAWYGGARRTDLHAAGAKFIGIYAYITAGQDAAAQARALVQLLGRLRPGEKVIADIEEGAGDQQQRWVTWAGIIHDGLGDDPWDYSGLNFAAAHGLAPVDWVAAYQSGEPAVPHKLWQFTDSYQVPGVGTCDLSVYRGTIDQLAALAYQGKGTTVTTPASPLPAITGQAGWQHCGKCQGLFWGPGAPSSKCPGGGQHDGTGSGNYVLIDLTK